MVFLTIFLLTLIASGFFMAVAFTCHFWLLFGLLVAIDVFVIIYAVVDYGQYGKKKEQAKKLRQVVGFDVTEPEISADPKRAGHWLVKRIVVLTESYSSEKTAKERKALIRKQIEETVFTNKRSNNGKDDI